MADDNLQDGIDKIKNLEIAFKKNYIKDKKDIDYRIDKMYENEETRPYSLILKYYKLVDENDEVSYEFLDEMEQYSYNSDMASLLLKIYREYLFDIDLRIKFYDLIKITSRDLKFKSIQYYFYMGIADYYSYQFKSARERLNQLRHEYPNAILNKVIYWLEDEENEKIFTGKIDQHSKGKFMIFKPNKFGGSNWLKLKNRTGIKIIKGTSKQAKIRFTYSGLIAEII